MREVKLFWISFEIKLNESSLLLARGLVLGMILYIILLTAPDDDSFWLTTVMCWTGWCISWGGGDLFWIRFCSNKTDSAYVHMEEKREKEFSLSDMNACLCRKIRNGNLLQSVLSFNVDRLCFDFLYSKAWSFSHHSHWGVGFHINFRFHHCFPALCVYLYQHSVNFFAVHPDRQFCLNVTFGDRQGSFFFTDWFIQMPTSRSPA